MKKVLLFSISIILTFIFVYQPGTAIAGPYQAKHKQQMARINQGVTTGAISPREASRLYAQQTRIGAQRAAYLSDGVLTYSEARSLKRSQERASTCIYRQKYDSNNW